MFVVASSAYMNVHCNCSYAESGADESASEIAKKETDNHKRTHLKRNRYWYERYCTCATTVAFIIVAFRSPRIRYSFALLDFAC